MAEPKLDDESLKAWCEYFKLLIEIEASIKESDQTAEIT